MVPPVAEVCVSTGVRARWPAFGIVSTIASSLVYLACAKTQPTPQPDLRPVNDAAMHENMILIPAGEFTMGSQPGDNWAENNEEPARVVYLEAFYIDQLEVTNLQFRRFLDATQWPIPGEWRAIIEVEDTEFLPVTGVSWEDATAYARWAGKRLPTEAEWEKAARGTDARRFPWGNEFDADRANNDRDLLAVGSKPEGASPYGVLDMAGNVAEWVSTPFAPYPRREAVLPGEFGGSTPAAPVTLPEAAAADTEAAAALAAEPGKRRDIAPDDPRLEFLSLDELQNDRRRVYRGGSYNSFARFLRASNRESASQSERWGNIGFRCAMDAERGTKP
jgi:formylglycine-generating enzyme required for sulfatase activity